MLKVILLIVAILYAVWPIDLLPDLIPGWGWIDDVIALFLILRYVITGKSPDFFRKNPFQFKDGSNTQNNSKKKYNTSDNQRSGDPYAGMTPHEILGVGPNASKAEIKAAYRELVSKYHPDKVQHLGEEFQKLAETRFKAISGAYQELINSY